MPEEKTPKQDKKLSMYPLSFEDALRGALQVEPPPKEKKDKPAPKRRKHASKAEEKKA